MTRTLPPLLLLAAIACAHGASPGASPASATAPAAAEKGGAEAKSGEAAAPATPAVPRASVLEEVAGVVRSVDRRAHTVTVLATGGPVTLSLDRNTMVYTAAGLGTVLDLVPGVHVRAGRNADQLAYWVQVRGATQPEPSPNPGQGTGPGGGSTAPPERGGPAGGTPPEPSPAPQSPSGVTPGSGPGTRP
jgi:hypothetical protein